MKKSKILCSVLLAVLVVIAQIPAITFAADTAPQNQIINSGFDTWSYWNDSQITSKAGVAHENKDALGRWVDEPGFVIPNGSGAWQWTTLKPNTTYTLTAMAKAAADAGSKGKITTMGSGVTPEPEVVVDSADWKEYTMTFTTGAEAKAEQSQILLMGTEGSGFIIDDVKLVEVGAATTANEGTTDTGTTNEGTKETTVDEGTAAEATVDESAVTEGTADEDTAAADTAAESTAEEAPVANPETGSTTVWLYAVIAIAAIISITLTGKRLNSQKI